MIRTSSAMSSGSGKSSSSGSRKIRIRFGNGAQSAPYSLKGTPSYSPYSVSSGPQAVLAQLIGGGLVRDDQRDLVERGPERRRDPGHGAIDEVLEALVADGIRPAGRGSGAAAALAHRARILAAMPHRPAADPAGAPETDALFAWSPDSARAPGADPDTVPEGFVVLADGDVRLHFLDWGGPPDGGGVLLLPGLLQPAWSWTPVARRLAADRRTIVADLRGHGLSDSPLDGYELATLAGDAIAVAEGAGIMGSRPITLAGHGFGGIVAAATAVMLGDRCAGLVLVDGGWERLETTLDVDVDEFLRGIDEPPEVMRSMDAYLADRRAFDAATWDGDQERAARDAVVETAAGHVVRAVRPHVVEAMVRTMFEYEPGIVLAQVVAPVIALVALGAGNVDARLSELRRTAAMRVAAGRGPIHVASFPSDAHNLMRYRPAEVAAAVLDVAG